MLLLFTQPGELALGHVSVAGSEAASDLLAVYFQAGIVDAVFIGKTGCGSAW